MAENIYKKLRDQVIAIQRATGPLDREVFDPDLKDALDGLTQARKAFDRLWSRTSSRRKRK